MMRSLFPRVRNTRPKLAVLAAPVIALALGASSQAWADSYTFSVSGSGITASGVLQASSTGPVGAYTVTGISGTFTDTNNGISGPITGLLSAGPLIPNGPSDPPNTFVPSSFTASGFSYDNLFWPGGDSPAVCAEALAFFGGIFDIYGLAFNVAGGYDVDIWSNGALGGYQVGDGIGSTKLSPEGEGVGYSVNITSAATPEPSTFMLLGTGLAGFGTTVLRRRKARA